MGAGHSKPDESRTFYGETPIEFSQDVVGYLADKSASPDVPPSRQTTLDGQIRAKIDQELSRLRQDEQTVREEIERALEKENLDKERSMAEAGNGKSSVSLLGDVHEVQQKVERYQSRAGLEDYATIRELGAKVATCYRNNPSTTLDCWLEVAHFKDAVHAAEQNLQRFVKTIQ